MAKSNVPQELLQARERTRRDQMLAADPTASVWVSANAGTGKTHVLTRRVLRILLAGTPPERILCLTYTKAAAAEMSKRVFDVLGAWAIAPPKELTKSLEDILGRSPNRDEIERAQVLFAQAIETPGGFKVQTIHAFCERLLQRFPLEAGVPPHFTILEDETGRALERAAIDEVLTEATGAPQSELGRALHRAIAYAAEDNFDAVIRQAIGEAERITVMLRALRPDVDPYEGIDRELRDVFAVDQGVDADSIERELADLIPTADLNRAIGACSQGTKSDVALAEILQQARYATQTAVRASAIEAALLTQDGIARKRLFTKAIQEQHSDLHARLQGVQQRAEKLVQGRQSLALIEATKALVRLASAVLQRYRQHKARRAALDFDDLIESTALLLSTPQSAEWVLYKLDGGLDHILLDESQDTAPVQWRVIEALAGEFFSGMTAREDQRSIFAVGDEKQSIYSFQGAEPAEFDKMGKRFAARAQAANATWHRIPLNLSFRTVEPLLEAVDAVFRDARASKGLSYSAPPPPHIANRFDEAGLIEIWDTEKADAVAVADPYNPNAEPASSDPATRLATRIAKTIAGWIDSGEELASAGRPIRAGDILILVKKRHPFAGPMVSALKTLKVPVAGADRISITEQIAVQDLVALGEFLTLPEDELSLASVLKSPLFGITEQQLFDLAYQRRGTLWSALLKRSETDERFGFAARTLKVWRARADFMPPYEFFAAMLDQKSGELSFRQRMLARLGSEAADPIDEFLNLALDYDESEPPSLQGFLAWIRQGTREVKRDMDQGRDEVRVMTVHGAKGLEAPIVFLPDTCTTKSGRMPGSLLPLASGARVSSPTPLIWPIKGSSKLPAVAQARAKIEDAEGEEYNRLLYVAMTRPRDRLYVAGFESAKGRAKGCWYDLISESMAGTLETVQDIDGRKIQRRHTSQGSPANSKKAQPVTDAATTKLPDWARRPAPTVATRAIPLVPSRLAPLEADDEVAYEGESISGEMDRGPRFSPTADTSDRRAGSTPSKAAATNSLADPPPLAPAAMADGHRFLRGTITHALLEHLPSIERAHWPSVAKAFIARRAEPLSPNVRAGIEAEVFAILADPNFAPCFSATSRAEVPIVAEIPPPGGKGPPLRIVGQIDRLAILEGKKGREVLIIDYKTNRPPPHDPAKVARSYLLQLAAYRLALRATTTAKLVRAAILWTDGPRIMEIPAALLDAHEGELWRLDQMNVREGSGANSRATTA